jgi:hypothetical protein
MEILGDLKKETEEGKSPSSERVKDFANKLFPLETVVSLHYKVLVKGDLLGKSVTMDGRPNVGIGKAVSSSSGQKGYIVQETEEEKSIYKWKEGNFSEADHELSKLWRVSTTEKDILTRLRDSLKASSKIQFANFEELDNFVDKILNQPVSQQSLLMALLQNYEVDAYSGTEIFGRWFKEGKPAIKVFSPYAFHCLKVDTLFVFGLASGIIGTRPTNRVDLEYLYYLPFGNVFTSNDKFHKNLVPLLLMPYQKFIVGTDLKNDLKNIVAYIDTLEVEEKKKYKNKPPVIENSITFELWKEHYGYPKTSNWNRNISPGEKERMIKKMKEFEKAMEGENINLENVDDAEFVIRKSYLSKNDPCFCGSGKRVIDCCIPEEKFNELAREEILRQRKKRIKPSR